MRVEVHRADREPAVVHDADLGVHVHVVARLLGLDGQGEQPTPGVLVAEAAELAERRVLACVGVVGQHDDDPEVVARRPPQLRREDVDDLRRPQELVLQVDEPLRRAEGVQVGAERPEVAVGGEAVDALGDRPDQPGRDRAHRLRHRGRRQPLPRHLAPALPKMRHDVGHHRPRRAHRGVVPAVGVAGRVTRRVPAVGAQRGQVKAADERDLVVDDQQLLVVAVEQVLVGVQGARDAVDRVETPGRGRIVGARGMDHRQQRPQGAPRVGPAHREGRVRAPAGEVDRAAGALDRGRHRGEGVLPVDEHPDVVALPDAEPARAERPDRRLRAQVPGPPQPRHVPAPEVLLGRRADRAAGGVRGATDGSAGFTRHARSLGRRAAQRRPARITPASRGCPPTPTRCSS